MSSERDYVDICWNFIPLQNIFFLFFHLNLLKKHAATEPFFFPFIHSTIPFIIFFFSAVLHWIKKKQKKKVFHQNSPFLLICRIPFQLYWLTMRFKQLRMWFRLWIEYFLLKPQNRLWLTIRSRLWSSSVSLLFRFDFFFIDIFSLSMKVLAKLKEEKKIKTQTNLFSNFIEWETLW